jgi:RNA polymerase sigma-70 factor (ECF subfamily)
VFGEDLSDANLFRRVRKNDPRAFGVLLRRHDPALRKLAARLLVDDERVDPILHKAYTKAWRSAGVARLGNVKGPAVLNWLYRLVYNACVDELRQQAPKPAPEPPSGARVRLPKAPEERRKAALRALAPSERIPLVLVDSEGFSIEDAARILQRPPPRVVADLDRARSSWRDMVIGPPAPQPAGTASGPPAPRHAARTAGSDGNVPNVKQGSDGKPKPGSQDEVASQDAPTEAGEGPASGNGAKDATDPVEASEPDQSDQSDQPDKADRQRSKLKVPARRKSPEIADPDEVVYAAEGVFDSVRFSNLKQWFKDSRQGTPTK